MRHLSPLIRIIALLATAAWLPSQASARDIRFYQTGGCHNNSRWYQCGDIGAGVCCQAARPFCRFVECAGCVVGNDIYSFNQARCNIGAHNSCRDGVDAHCCIGAGNGNTCAAQWNRGGGPGRLVVMSGSVPPENPNLGKECELIVECNQLNYQDGEGVQRQIFIPKGTMSRATELLEAENWEELAKFPVWGKSFFRLSRASNNNASC